MKIAMSGTGYVDWISGTCLREGAVMGDFKRADGDTVVLVTHWNEFRGRI